MYIRRSTSTYTKNCSEQIQRLKNEIETADAIVIGAGAGMSTSACMAYDGERFEKNFADFQKNMESVICTREGSTPMIR